MMTRLETIDDFLAQERLAIAGVSRKKNDFTRIVFRELRDRGYKTIPVNPNAGEIEGTPSYPRLQDIEEPIDGALLFTPPNITEQVVRDCTEAGIRRVWMHRGYGKGSVSQSAIEYCEKNGIAVIHGLCPLMFLPNTGLVHRIHRLILQVIGRYPS